MEPLQVDWLGIHARLWWIPRPAWTAVEEQLKTTNTAAQIRKKVGELNPAIAMQEKARTVSVFVSLSVFYSELTVSSAPAVAPANRRWVVLLLRFGVPLAKKKASSEEGQLKDLFRTWSERMPFFYYLITNMPFCEILCENVMDKDNHST